MLYLSPEGFSPLQGVERVSIYERIFEFDPGARDYVYKRFLLWDKITSDVFTLKTNITNTTIYVPSGFYVFVGSDEGASDWIMVDELIGRDIEVFCISSDFNDFVLETVSLTSVVETTFYYPMTKNPIPVTDLYNKKVFLCCSSDPYLRLKSIPVGEFFVNL